MARVNMAQYQTMTSKWHSTFTEKNHLGTALMLAPTKFKDAASTAWIAQGHTGANLSGILKGKAGRKTINPGQNIIEWSLKGRPTRPVIIVEDVMKKVPSNLTALGKGGIPFKMKLAENWFDIGDTLFAGTSDKRNQVRIVSDPVPHGGGFVYEVVIAGKNRTSGFAINRSLFRAGSRWVRIFSTYEEGSDTLGTVQFSTDTKLAMEVGTRLRKHYKITGDAHNAGMYLAMNLFDSKGGMHKTWMRYQEAEFYQQFELDRERAIMLGRQTDETVLGDNGRPVISGPGMQELLEGSNIEYYSKMSTTLVEEFLGDQFFGRTAPGSGNRDIVAFTGERGMFEFHKAIVSKFNDSGFITVDSNFIKSHNSPYTHNGLQFGGQFTKYLLGNGGSLTLVHLPIYDDNSVNMEIDPLTGYNVESLRYTFLDFSGKGISDNIFLLDFAKSYKQAYECGMHTPLGPSEPSNGYINRAHMGDYYTLGVQDDVGVWFKDVSRCGELILRRNSIAA